MARSKFIFLTKCHYCKNREMCKMIRMPVRYICRSCNKHNVTKCSRSRKIANELLSIYNNT